MSGLIVGKQGGQSKVTWEEGLCSEPLLRAQKAQVRAFWK